MLRGFRGEKRIVLSAIVDPLANAVDPAVAEEGLLYRFGPRHRRPAPVVYQPQFGRGRMVAVSQARNSEADAKNVGFG